jgi:glycosyltransferase involved in cell wall biosynthesis
MWRVLAEPSVDDMQSKPRLLALSSPGAFSGLPDAVLGQLRRYSEIVSVVDGLRVPLLTRLSLAVSTVRPARADWGRQYYARLGSYYKRPSSLLYRIGYCERRLRGARTRYDLIYQFGALFGALDRPPDAPLALHIDFTTRLAEEHYPGWLPASKSETEEWNEIERKIYGSADLIFVPTELVAASLHEHYSVQKEKVAVVGMGAHIDDLAEDFTKFQGRTLVFAGADFVRHGGALALQVFEAVRERLTDTILIMVTDRHVDAPGVQNVGIVPRPRLHQILKDASVLLMPGPVGGYQTVTEAMAAKCLCLVSANNPHMSGLIRGGENGMKMDAPTLKQSVESLIRYLNCPGELAGVGELARQHVIRECTWPRVVARVWEEIELRFIPLHRGAGPLPSSTAAAGSNSWRK